MDKKEQIIEAILVSLCKFTIFIVYPAIFYLVTKDKKEIYLVSE